MGNIEIRIFSFKKKNFLHVFHGNIALKSRYEVLLFEQRGIFIVCLEGFFRGQFSFLIFLYVSVDMKTHVDFSE